jgi:hypothetical protein
MAKVRINFREPNRIKPFVAGIEFVNDSSLTVEEIGDDYIIIDDEDRADDAEYTYNSDDQ